MALSAALSPALSGSDDAAAAPAAAAAAKSQPGFLQITAAFHAASAAAAERGSPELLVVEPVLRAVSAFLTVFDALESPVVTQLVAADFRWKTGAVRAAMARLAADEGGELVRLERDSPPGFFDASAVDGLRWARRILAFVDALVLHLVRDKHVELRDAALDAYRDTIGLRHSAVTKVVFENALLLLPSKAKFITNLFGVEDPTEAQMADIDEELREFRIAVRPHIDAFDALFGEE